MNLRNRNYLIESAPKKVTKSSVANLKPRDRLIVYHATPSHEFPKLANGIDALKIRSRSYNQGNHRGLFVAPSKEVARSFGNIILKLSLPVRNMHSPIAYSGRTNDKKEDDIFREIFPNSFRPSVSFSLTARGGEPQSLYIGYVRPKDILAVYDYDPSSREVNKVMSLKDAKKFYKVEDYGLDVTSPKFSLDDYSKAMEFDKEKMRKAFMRYNPKSASDLEDLIKNGGFGSVPMSEKGLKHLSKDMAKQWGIG